MVSIANRISAARNDYGDIETAYETAYGEAINSEPFVSLVNRKPYRVDQRVSVIIPVWNTGATLPAVLRALELSEICRCQPDMLEIVVIDDGSENEVSSLLEGERFVFAFQIVRQRHSSRACAINTGVWYSTGALLMFLDSDWLFGPYSLDEIIKRQQMFPENAIFFGFREDVPGAEVDFRNLSFWLSRQIPAFWNDNRFRFDYPDDWGSNMMLETDMLRGRRGNRNIWVCDGKTPVDDCWQLYRMVYGCFFSVSRNVFLHAGGFDECMVGWGWEDSAFVGKCISRGVRIVPVPSAFAFHIAHGDRSPGKWEEAEANWMRLTRLFARKNCERLAAENIAVRIEYSRDYPAQERNVPTPDNTALLAYTEMQNPLYDYRLGNISKAAVGFENGWSGLDVDAISMYLDCLIRLHDVEKLSVVLRDPRTHGVFEAMVAIWLFDLDDIKPDFSQADTHIRHCMLFSPQQHLLRAELYFDEGQYYLAYRDLVAAALTGKGERSKKMEECEALFLTEKARRGRV